ncbi:sensor histidine kinase [uncultured Aquitalea sp.]|uniref:sensor histidine kinase n=1 Tax=uncultured Aquitalea sp. TaxID=540272 RepID=UPI0025EAABC5|nr:sensor histidine kinase [uncultured Aquitalea sp.]
MSALRSSSLRRRLVIWLLAPLLSLLALDAWLTYHRARQAADAAFDRMLATSARAIAEGVTLRQGGVEVDIPYFALEMFESNANGRVFYRVLQADGKQLTGYEDLPLPNADWPAKPQARFYDIRYRDEALRLVALPCLARDILTLGSARVWVLVAETPESRHQLAQGILLGALRQEGLLVACMLAIVLVGITFALRPLHGLSQRMAERGEDDLSPLDAGALPREIRPLVAGFNQYTSRLQRMLAARRRFFADAAHQLKTPLAVMQAQLELAQRETDPAQRRKQQSLALATLKQASHGVEQLLSLSRLEPDSGHSVTLESVDLPALARDGALEWAVVAHQRQVDLGFDDSTAAAPCLIEGHPMLLQELAGNLVDNAIRYAGGRDGAQVTVRVGCDDCPWLEVEDNGPGIPPEEREKVFQRFYRLRGNTVAGTGLGLAIVREIARLHGAEVSLRPTRGGGLTVRVMFPPTGG